MTPMKRGLLLEWFRHSRFAHCDRPKDDPDEKGIVTEGVRLGHTGPPPGPKDDPDEKGIVTLILLSYFEILKTQSER